MAKPYIDIHYRNRKTKSPSLNWSSLQNLLETAIPNVLIILDCCFAANAARDTGDGTTKELLAACSRESPTYGVGVRSFTSALVEELQAFGDRPFTAAMLHSRLVTMRWRLAFTPIYALLSEQGGNSISLCRFPKVQIPVINDPESAAQPHSTVNALDISLQDKDPPMVGSWPSSLPPQSESVDTRVLLSVSVNQNAFHDVSQWATWLTTAAPWDVSKVDVRIQSIFRSHSTLVIVSVPTFAWDRLPERPAYRFIGFVKSEDLLRGQEAKAAPIASTLSSLNTPSDPNVENHACRNRTAPPASSSGLATPILYSATDLSTYNRVGRSESATFSTKRRTSNAIDDSTPKKRSKLSSTGDNKIYQDRIADTSQSWPPQNDALLLRARQQGLNWQPIATTYFPDKTANACRKRHERLIETRNTTDDMDKVEMETLSKAYVDVREQMWKLLANRLGENWKTVEAKVSINCKQY